AQDYVSRAQEQFNAAAKLDKLYRPLSTEPDKYVYVGNEGNQSLKSVVLIAGDTAGGAKMGTGFSIGGKDKVTYVVTNNHVVTDVTSLSILYRVELNGSLERRTSKDVRVVLSDEENDLALLEVETEQRLPALPLRKTTDGLRVPMKVTLIGHPKGLDY